MQHECSDNMVTPWGGMKEMKMLIDKTGISKKLLELGLPQGKSWAASLIFCLLTFTFISLIISGSGQDEQLMPAPKQALAVSSNI